MFNDMFWPFSGEFFEVWRICTHARSSIEMSKAKLRNNFWYVLTFFQGSSSRSDAFARMQGHPSRYQRPKRVNDRQCWGQIGWFWRQRPAGSNDRPSQYFYWHPILDGSRGKSLVHLFNNRWRWCCDRFNFTQNAQQLGYERSFSRLNLFHSFGFDFILKTIHDFRIHSNTSYLPQFITTYQNCI